MLEDCISDLCMNVIFDEHRTHKLSRLPCQICLTRCRHKYLSSAPSNSSSSSINGLSAPPSVSESSSAQMSTERFECPSCRMSFPNTRYAPHLEKCLGLGRNVRAAFRKWDLLLFSSLFWTIPAHSFMFFVCRGQNMMRQNSPSASVDSDDDYDTHSKNSMFILYISDHPLLLNLLLNIKLLTIWNRKEKEFPSQKA